MTPFLIADYDDMLYIEYKCIALGWHSLFFCKVKEQGHLIHRCFEKWYL